MLECGSSTGVTQQGQESHTAWPQPLSSAGVCPAGKSELLGTPCPKSAVARHNSDLLSGFGPWISVLLPRELWKAIPGTQELPRNHLLSDMGGTGGSTDTSPLLGLTFKCLPHLPGVKLRVNAASHRNAYVH